MIQDIQKGRGFKGALKYATEKEKAVRIGGTMIGNSIDELVSEAGKVRGLNPKLNRAVFHTSLSISPNESLTEQNWLDISEKYMSKMGFENAPYVICRHYDAGHDHIHIVGLRIDATTGKTISDAKDYERGALIVQEIEKEYGLIQAAQTPAQAWEKPIKNLKRNEIDKAIRTGEAPARQVLQQIVDEAIIDQPDIFEFIERLEIAGVYAKPAVASTGRMNGFSFEYGGLAFKASELGKQYGWKSLSESVNYEQNADGERLIEIASAARHRPDKVDSRASDIDRGNEHQHGVIDGRKSDDIIRDDEYSERINENNATEFNGKSTVDSEVNRDKRSGGGGNKENKNGIIGNNGSDKREIDINNVEFSINNIRNSVGGLSDLAAALVDRREKSNGLVSRDSISGPGEGFRASKESLAPDHIQKIKAWELQHSALQAPEYRITVVPRRDDSKKTFSIGKRKDGTEKLFNGDEVKDLIGKLRRLNALGYDIYLTPVDKNQHYILLDDTTQKKIDDLKNKGLQPVLVQQSSAGNLQAVYKAGRDSERKHKVEQKDGTRLLRILNRFHGDKKITGAIHPFRMSGFTNAKPKNEVNGVRPITRILEVSDGNSLPSELMIRLREKTDKKLAVEKIKEEKQARQIAILTVDKTLSAHDIRSKYASYYKKHEGLYKKIWQSQGKKLDQSTLDYRVAQDLIVDGYGKRQIENVIVDMSPDLSARHDNVQDYVERTVDKAAASDKVRIAINRAIQEKTKGLER